MAVVADEDILLDFEFEEDDTPPTADTSLLDEALSKYDAAFFDDLIEKIYLFVLEFSGIPMFPYQEEISKRIIRSMVCNEGAEITAIISRQAGKTEALANTVAGLMVLLPRLAKVFPDILGKFARGLWVGTFAPVETQAETLHGRIVDRLTSEHAVEIMLDPEIDDHPKGGGRLIRLAKSGSFCRMQTANPKAKIESKSYHLIIIDEAQDVDEYTVEKSIMPMGTFYNSTSVMIGTPTTHKGVFYRSIQQNKRSRHGGKFQLHFEYDWRTVVKYNPDYRKAVMKEMRRKGEDSDAFQMSFACKWLLDRGMFISEGAFDELGDTSMERQVAYTRTPVVVGLDPGRKHDSTVVTVVWVDWDRPDEFGFYDHRVLNWLELHGEDWEAQYAQIVNFLSNYNVLGVAVDANGMGGPVAERLAVLLPRVQVVSVQSDRASQSKRWKHLTQLIQRRLISWPAHAKTKRLKVWQHFNQQMIDLEKKYEGQLLLAEAPDEQDAHDDFPDSLALACMLTADLQMPTVQEHTSPFYSR